MGKYIPHTNIHYEKAEIKDETPITRDMIEDAKKTIKVGDQFAYYKRLDYGAKGEYTDAYLINARVVEVYSNFFIVEAENGKRESILWVELVLSKFNGKGVILG